MQLTIIAILGLSFPVLLLVGIPISAAIALSSFLAFFTLYDPLQATQLIGHTTIASMDNFGLLAIPFFILAGNIMSVGGIAKRLINFAKVLFGPIPGSLAYCNVLANAMFGSVSGSAVAAAAAIGSTMGPEQKKAGYDPSFSAAVNISSCPSGLLIPPSNALLLYGLTTGGTSIVALFVAGYIPGIVMSLAVATIIYMKRKEFPRGDATLWNKKKILKSFLEASPSLFMIFLVMGGMVWGIFTPTEASVISVLYSMLLAAIYREMDLKDAYRILTDSVISTCVVIFLIAASTSMSWLFSVAEIPKFVSAGLLSISNEPWVILLIMNIILLIVGTFMDLTPIILIFTPIFFPVAMKIGINPVHFGIIMVYNTCIGLITPPVGNALFVGSGISGVKIEKIVPKLVPLFVAQIIGLMLVTYWPTLSLWLPTKFGLMP